MAAHGAETIISGITERLFTKGKGVESMLSWLLAACKPHKERLRTRRIRNETKLVDVPSPRKKKTGTNRSEMDKELRRTELLCLSLGLYYRRPHR